MHLSAMLCTHMNTIAQHFKHKMTQTCSSSHETGNLVHLTEAGIKNWAKVLGWRVKGYFLKYNSLEKKANNNKKTQSNYLQLLFVP